MSTSYDETKVRKALLSLPEDYHRLAETPIFHKEEYLAAVEKLEETVMNAARLHRNWNEDIKALNFPEASYPYDAECGLELPAGWEPPIAQQEITEAEYSAYQLYINVSRANLKSPSLASLYAMSVMDRTIQRMITDFNLMTF